MKRVVVLLLVVAVVVIALLFAFRAQRSEPTAAAKSAELDSQSAPPAKSAPPPQEPAPVAAAAPAASDQSDSETREQQAGRSRIVNGENADAALYPWIAAIGERDEHGNVKSYCAGTLIARQWLLTAAHCKVLEGDYAVLGRSDLASSAGHIVKIVHMITHRMYDKSTLNYDIALAKLETATDDVPPLKLIDECKPAPDAGGSVAGGDAAAAAGDCEEMLHGAGNLSIAGWGRLGEFTYQTPNDLQKADVMLFSHDTCADNYAAIHKVVTANMFCAQGLNAAGNITDACKGDSGGPIVGRNHVDKNKVVLAGVISKGAGCAQQAYPGIYTNLAMLRSWVDQCMKEPEPVSCS
jgi:secreted trypsin-like serine protease